jgi:hypothetical protein
LVCSIGLQITKHICKLVEINGKGSVRMFLLGLYPILLFIVYGVVTLMVIYCLYLLIKLLIRAIKALDIHLDEKKNKYL